jgi:hypothetical protein
MLNKLLEVMKSYRPKAIKENWKSIDEKKKQTRLLSEKTGLKKIYFESLSEEQSNQELKNLGFKPLRLGRDVYQYYRDNVKGNKNISKEQARLKLTRNVMLAEEGKHKGNRKMYMYGNLWMLVVKDKIVWIKNLKAKNNSFSKDLERYNQINKELGIID